MYYCTSFIQLKSLSMFAYVYSLCERRKEHPFQSVSTWPAIMFTPGIEASSQR